MIKNINKYIILILVTFFIFIFGFKKPKQNRNWALDQSILSKVSFLDDNQIFNIQNIRNWKYQSLNTIQSKKYFDASYRYIDLESINFYVAPLDKKELTAHTFVVFNFGTKYGKKQNLALSIEARREKNVAYSMLKGIFNQY